MIQCQYFFSIFVKITLNSIKYEKNALFDGSGMDVALLEL